jgi:nucleoside 2-deoxyribosyltransferase
MVNVHVIGPVIRDPNDDLLLTLGDEQVALSAIYHALHSESRFTAHIPKTNDLLDAASPQTLFVAMQHLIANADRVVWVFHKEPAGAVEAGIAIAAGKPLYLLASEEDLPRIVRGIPNALVSSDVNTLCDDIATGKTAIDLGAAADIALVQRVIDRLTE